MTEHEILKDAEETRVALYRAKGEKRRGVKVNIAPFQRAARKAQQALEDYRAACRAKAATEIARTEFGLVVGDVVELPTSPQRWRITKFVHGLHTFIRCEAVNVLKSGADGKRQNFVEVIKGKYKKIGGNMP